MNGIEIKNVSKQYKNVAALDDVTLTFAPGKIYGLLGPQRRRQDDAAECHREPHLCRWRRGDDPTAKTLWKTWRCMTSSFA